MITVDELIKSGAIYFEHITQGFDLYNHKIVKWNQEEAYNQLENLCIINGYENSFADFYYYKIEEEARQKVDKLLSEEERSYLRELKHTKDSLIYQLNPTLLKIIVKLNATEALFSTIYLTKSPCTLWGNYNMEYVIFVKPCRNN